MKKSMFYLVFFFLVSTLSLTSVSAQSTRGTAPTLPNAPVDTRQSTPTDIPFDGGLSLVAIAGAAYAARKSYQRKMQRSR